VVDSIDTSIPLTHSQKDQCNDIVVGLVGSLFCWGCETHTYHNFLTQFWKWKCPETENYCVK